ncbi:MAG: AAA family ATPase [Pseudomonadota bacterium]
MRPPAFEGRDALMEDVDVALDRVLGGLHANGKILLGLRGVGKTVLLNALHDTARAKGFETIRFEVRDRQGSNLTRALVPDLGLILRRLDRMAQAEHHLASAAQLLQMFAAKFRISHDGISFGVSPPEVAEMQGDLERDLPLVLTEALVAAKARGTAIGIFIDEVQYLTREELSALSRLCHDASQRALPLLVIATGLPQIAALAGDAKSYAERLFDYPEVGALDPQAAQRALTRPIEAQGVTIEPSAVDQIYADTQGYAYFLQSWGKQVWDGAARSPITADDVTEARLQIDRSLDESFFRVRFDQCTPSEQRYLRGMAELGAGPHQTGDIAGVLDVKSSTVAPVRKKLIDRGMIFSQRYGETAFTVPLFHHFMKRAMPDMRPYSVRRRP